MAKKKSKKSTTRRRPSRRGRGRVGSFGGVSIENAALALGGGLAGRVVTNVTANIPMVQKKPIIRVGGKALISYFLLQQKSPMLVPFTYGFLGETALDAAGIFAPNVFGPKLAPKIGATVIDLDNVSGYNEDYGVAGVEDLAVAGVV